MADPAKASLGYCCISTCAFVLIITLYLRAGNFWHGVKKTFKTTPVDEKESEHREGFTALVRELKAALSLKPHLELGVTILPNVNSTSKYLKNFTGQTLLLMKNLRLRFVVDNIFLKR